MALLFDAGTEKVEHGSASDLDSMVAGTVVIIFRPSALSGNQHLFRKNGTQLSRLLFGAAGVVEFAKGRSTQSCTTITSSGIIVADAWQALVAVWDLNGANGDQHLYHAALGGALTEPTYSTQRVGSGTHDDSAGVWTVGHAVINNSATFQGEMARFMVYDRTLTLGEAMVAVYGYLPGALLHCEYGWDGTGAQTDLSGHGHHGTITGATLATVHAPLALPWDTEDERFTVGGIQTHPTIAGNAPVADEEDVGWEGAFSSGGGPQSVTPDPAVATWTVNDPTRSAAVSLTPDPATQTWTANAPTVATAVSLTPDPAIATWTANAPTVTAAISLTPSPATSTWVVNDPTVATAVSVTPDPATSTWTAHDPAITAAVSRTPDPAVSTWVANDATASVEGAVTPDAAVSSWVVLTPTVTTSVAVTADPAVSAWTALTPTVTAAVTVQPDPAVSTWTALAPVVTGAVSVTPDPAVSLWTVLAPTAALGSQAVTADPAVATWVVNAPTVTTQTLYRLTDTQGNPPSGSGPLYRFTDV